MENQRAISSCSSRSKENINFVPEAVVKEPKMSGGNMISTELR